MGWQTFWVEDVGEVLIRLRRYALGADVPCPEGGYHHASSGTLGRRPARRDGEGNLRVPDRRGHGRRHPAWPRACTACGWRFRPEDAWQIDQEAVYRRVETGEEWGQRSLPPGAMFDAVWAPPAWRGADGTSLAVVLPPALEDQRPNVWMVDGPARDVLPAWTRTGDPRAIPPTVSVTPSILTPWYHGYLTDGVLTPSMADRPLPE